MESKDFFLDNDGLKIHCRLDCPKNMQPENGRRPLLILQHGLTGSLEDAHIAGIAKRVVSAGFAVLRADLYGHGKSGGEFGKHTVLKWVDQMLSVINYADSLDFVSDLYLAGHSQGGLTALLAGAMEKGRLDAVILLSPALIIWDGARRGSLMGNNFDPDTVPNEFDSPYGKVFTGDYLRTARLLPVEESIRLFDKPVLLVHGEADEAVPVRYAYYAATLYKNCKLKIIKDCDHCYNGHLKEAENAVCDFLSALQVK